MTNKQVVLVTGGSRGLGESIVQKLLEKNYIVGTCSRKESALIRSLRKKDPKEKEFMWRSVDTTNEIAIVNYVKELDNKYNRIDHLINNAAIKSDEILPLLTNKDIENLIITNIESPIKLSRVVLKIMIRKEGRTILNIGSIAGSRGFKGSTLYSASKAAMEGFTRSLARELGAKGIRVNTICPGYLETEMTAEMTETQKKKIIKRTPLGRLGKVEDIVGIVTFLLSEEAEFITGQSFVIDGGLTC